MFKGLLFVTAVVSAVACLTYDVVQRVNLLTTQHEIAVRRAELEKYAASDADLRRRTDLINQLKQVQRSTDPAVEMLEHLRSEASAIESTVKR